MTTEEELLAKSKEELVEIILAMKLSYANLLMQYADLIEALQFGEPIVFDENGVPRTTAQPGTQS